MQGHPFVKRKFLFATHLDHYRISASIEVMSAFLPMRLHQQMEVYCMKGNEKIIEELNARLAEELTAINQYMVHSEMCENWKYERLHKAIEKRAMDEMRHAEKLIARILFLEGRPIVSNLNKIHIGAEVPKMHQNDHSYELEAINNYNETIRLAVEVGDNGTREILEDILRQEEGHIDWIEAQLDQIKQMGPQNYLVEQID